MTEKKHTADAPHLATARKWRPQVFGDIVGQSHITTTLRNAVAAGRIGHAYLFSGPRGVGKTTTARILAKAINCLHPRDSDPDNACENCIEITEGRSVNVFEIDGASNRGVDEIRNLREAVRYGPGKGKYKVYIIDEVHMLTNVAFNALLKTLEEPPSYIVFIFATTEEHRVPPTILSRCQRFEFRRIAAAEIVSSIAAIAKTEKIDMDDAALDLIARRADGSLRDSQSIFDQVVSFCGGKITVEDVRSLLKIVDDEFYFRVTGAVALKDAGAGFRIVDDVSRSGFDLREFAGGLADHFRNLLVVRSTGDTGLVDGSERIRKRYAETAKDFSEADLLRLMKLASDTEAAMRWSQQPRLKLELALQLMVSMDASVEIGRLIAGIDELKKKVEAAGPARLAAPVMALTEKSPAPFRGTVKATQPTLRPDQVVTPATAAVPVIATLIPAAVVGDWARNWQDIVEQVRREKIAIGSMLAETSFHAANGNSISIACPDDFHADVLKRNRQYISALAERIYGARFQFDSILEAMPARGSAGDGVGGRNRGADRLKDNPVVLALVREFGAEEIH
ncbi:MAG TPA: DNA polymerase III subunit gamma/tau [Bacteroidota bacterium]|nr:DNA polymerase III subunit gamma/tau [Bacteroidota bacterium]